MKLRSYYVLLASSIVVPVVLFCGSALDMLQRAQHDTAIGRLEKSATLTATMIDADIHRAQSVLRVLADSHSLARADLAGFDGEARRANVGPGGWIILYNPDGQQLVNTRLPFGAQLVKRPDVAVAQKMLATGVGMVSGIKWGDALRGHFVMVEMPIRAQNGRPYVIGQAFSPRFFEHTFHPGSLPPDWRVTILDQNGIVIARSQRADEFVGRKVGNHTYGVINAARTGVFKHVNGAGDEMYDAYTRSALSNWSIIIGAPVDEIDMAVRRGVGMMAAGLAIAIALTLALAMYAGRNLVRYVGHAAEGASLLGRGGEVRSLPRSAIVELERLNDAILEASRRLQAEVASRTRAESERNDLLLRERQARAAAEQQNAAKDEFLAMLGHELRNPLSAVTSAVAVLDSDAPLPPDAELRARDVLRRQTGHLRKLVDDLLEVNRALMGKLSLQTEAVDLAEVVRRCLDTLQASGRLRGFDLRVDIAPALVAADPTRLLQVIDNILDNAVKYSPGGGPLQVTVAHDGDQAVLRVRDWGQGIGADLLPSVFDVFVQGKQSLQRLHGGLGIGLSLVRRLVDLHGGAVSIESAGEGRGATVTVRLPRLAGVAAAAPAPRPERADHALRVLLIEDNADAREMLTMLLELRGCQVLAAESAAAGIALARAEAPALALVDIGLPGMDGYQVAQALRADPATRAIRLVALTGYGSDADRAQALEAGFERHVTKPLGLEQLDEVLDLLRG